MKKGFTLVELSIVLVIIGLLIGGILVGQSLIESAKVQSMVRTLQQYHVAIQQFGVKFKQLPGDSNRMNPPGDNDRTIEANTGTCSGTLGLSEQHQAWYHLASSQMIKLDIKGFSPAACGGAHTIDTNLAAGIYMPLFTKHDAYSQDYAGDGFGINRIPMNMTAGSVWAYSVYYNILAMDSKLDDGNMRTGIFMNGMDIGGNDSCANIGESSPQFRDKLMCTFSYQAKFL